MDVLLVPRQSSRILFHKYQRLDKIGEGAYGVVIRCRDLETGSVVAIKRFVGSEFDPTIRKIALREIRTLRRLHHPNLINLLGVFKKNHRYHLVFQYMEKNLLQELESNPSRLTRSVIRLVLRQIITATAFCHSLKCIHRDIKPENILLSHDLRVKLCDFGFARFLDENPWNIDFTEYVATRWYRAPELLVGDLAYGAPVDVWAIGCVFAEMILRAPLWPGKSDLDQLYLITRNLGNLTSAHVKIFQSNSFFSGLETPKSSNKESLSKHFARVKPPLAIRELSLMMACFCLDPKHRITCTELLKHSYFYHGINSALAPSLKKPPLMEKRPSHNPPGISLPKLRPVAWRN
ncbi:Cyclin-dependent kinase-like 1 [Cichlidogyrus casuarinus]|uniref:cyclin-dependent kinase n=1 Tax=Cichlidogyrus casuarinus TaxID=1844966 RepID=A0ABD2PK17_9PLAT